MKKYDVFNPEYTFDTFAVNTNNCLAYWGALAVAEIPGEVYNPLFLCGSSEPHKQQLMHSIGNYIFENHPSLRITYVTDEVFENRLREAFLAKINVQGIIDMIYEDYKFADVIFIDDIHYFSNTGELQTALLGILERFYLEGKQIIVSSHISGKDLSGIKRILNQKYLWSLIVDTMP